VLLKTLFWGSLGALAWTHVGYPVAVAALARVRSRPVRKEAFDELPTDMRERLARGERGFLK